MNGLPVRLLLLAAVGIWGWTFVATKVCLAYVGPVELVGLRFSLGLPVLLAIIAGKRLSLALAAGERRQAALAAGIMGFHFVLQAAALGRTSAVNSGWIIAVAPLATALLSWALLGERLSRTELAGMGLASAGILLLVSKGELGSLAWLRSSGDWMIFASAFTWALYTVATRDLARVRAALVVTFYVFLPSAVLGLGWMAARSRLTALGGLDSQAWLALAFLGVFGTAAQWFWQAGVARLGAARAGLFLYLEPLATTALAVPFLGERFGPATAAGGALVLAGVWWAQRR